MAACPLTALDVSADLTELGRTPVAVVSAGVKSILDIGRTLEYLVGSMGCWAWKQIMYFVYRMLSGVGVGTKPKIFRNYYWEDVKPYLQFFSPGAIQALGCSLT